MSLPSEPQSDKRLLVLASRLAAAWAFGYGLYRWYYAGGGTFGILGTPVSLEDWRRINAVAGALLFVAALLPLLLINAWARPRARPFLLTLSWIITVSCCSHALIGGIQRVLSLTRVITIPYPFWLTIDRRLADLQALFFNEPWFLLEGLLWAAIAWTGALQTSPRRWWWVSTAFATIAALTAIGILSVLGVIGQVIAG